MIMLDTLISNMTCCYNTAIRATGNIGFYELTYNLIHLLGIAIIILCVKLGCNYYIPYVMLAGFSFISMFWQFYCMKRVMPFVSIKDILISIFQMLSVVVLVTPIIYFVKQIDYGTKWAEFLIVLVMSVFFQMLFILLVGLTFDERNKLYDYIKKLHIANGKE